MRLVGGRKMIFKSKWFVSGSRQLTFITLAGIAAQISVVSSVWAAAACTGPIKFALTAPLTGDIVALGIQAKSAVQFAVNEINAGSGIAGQKVEVTFEDTKSSS